MAQKYAYWVYSRGDKKRAKVDVKLLSEDWAIVRSSEWWCYSSEPTFWHVVDYPGVYISSYLSYAILSYERKKWHMAGSIWTRQSKVRKRCVTCEKKIPVPMRVLFELKGKGF